MHIVKEEVAQNDNGVVQWKIEKEILEDGKYKGRKIWTNITLTNKDGNENEIGRALLRSIWEAIGLPLTQTDSTKALFKPFIGTVRTEKGTGGYKDKNKITYAAPVDAANKPKKASSSASTGEDTTPPWDASESSASNAPAAAKKPWKK